MASSNSMAGRTCGTAGGRQSRGLRSRVHSPSRYRTAFGCEMDRATADAIARIARSKGRRIVCADGEYRTWLSPGGAEIWLHYPRRAGDASAGRPLEPIDDLKGMTVFQRGASAIRMRVHRRLSWKPENALDGVCIGRRLARCRSLQQAWPCLKTVLVMQPSVDPMRLRRAPARCEPSGR